MVTMTWHDGATVNNRCVRQASYLFSRRMVYPTSPPREVQRSEATLVARVMAEILRGWATMIRHPCWAPACQETWLMR